MGLVYTTNMPDQNILPQKITIHLNQAGFPTTVEDVIPTTHETPITKSAELSQVGARIVGDTELETDLKDLQYIEEADLKQGDKTRLTASRNPLKMLLDKLMRKKSGTQEVVEK